MEPPEIRLGPDGLLHTTGVEIVAVPFGAADGALVLGPGAPEIDDAVDTDLLALLEHQQATGKAGEIVELPLLSGDGPRSALLVGTGSDAPADLRRAGAALARRVKGRSVVATSIAAAADDAGLRAFVEGLVLGSFTFHRRTTAPPAPVGTVVLSLTYDVAARQAVLDLALAQARAAWTARALALVPSNEKNPGWMVERARETASGAGLDVRVWDRRALSADGFGGILAVGQASDTPPALVQLSYTPATTTRRTPHVVLVGKGITFDTGGLSIKPSDAMMTMKRDMTGAGVVLAVMEALAAQGCPVRVTGLLALAENAVSGRALRPGDVIRHYGGRTTEVTNTDAEGRLVLADALAYAVAELGPDLLLDVATLTGAMKVALGQRTGGFFATDDALAASLREAGSAAGEPLWRLPLHDEYAVLLDSTVADADNAPGGPGAITAALFLQPFTGGLPWAHLDIASVGDSPIDAYEWTSGATGFGARLLLRWLEHPQVPTKPTRRGVSR